MNLEAILAGTPRSGRARAKRLPDRINVRLGKDWSLLWNALRERYPDKSDSQIVRDGLRALLASGVDEIDGESAQLVFKLGSGVTQKEISFKEYLKL